MPGFTIFASATKVRDRDDTACFEVQGRATKLTGIALENARGFARLASEFSDCGSKSSGGALGQLGPGDSVPEFEVALREMAEGEISSEPVLYVGIDSYPTMIVCSASSRENPSC